MTAAQTKARANFKKAIAYKQKTGVSLKEAFASVYGKKKVGAVKKKAAPKKKVGVVKSKPYKGYQYTIDENETGDFVDKYFTLTEAKKDLKKLEFNLKKRGKYKKDFYRITDINTGKTVGKIKVAKKVARKVVKKKAAPKKVAKKKLTSRDYDKRFQAQKPGKRTSASGNTYYEYRVNRSDKGKLLGIKIGNMPTYNDKDAAREIQIFADSDYMLYQQRKKPILINLGKKYKKGTYDINKAAKLWRYYIDAALQKYHKEYGTKGDNWYDMLSVPDRNLLSLDYAIETKNEFDIGNFTN